MRKIICVLLGLAVVYLTCAFLAMNLNPADWGWLLRGWALLWGIVWGIGGLMVGSSLDDDAAFLKSRRVNQKKINHI